MTFHRNGADLHVNADTLGARPTTEVQLAERRKWIALALLATTQFVTGFAVVGIIAALTLISSSG